MITALAKQLSARMKAKNITVTTLEREAGLNAHAALNILRGKSKDPSAKILQAIANVLGCTIPDLLDDDEMFQPTEISNTELLNAPYDHPEILQDLVALINAKIKKEDLNWTHKQVLTCVEEIYLHSLQRKLKAVDTKYAEWFFQLMKAE